MAQRSKLSLARAAAIAALPLFGLIPPPAAGAQSKACARSAPGTWTVNGIVATGASLGSCTANSNWSRVVPLKLKANNSASGNTMAEGTISLTRFGSHLYIGLTVANDKDLSDLDQVDLVFDKEGNHTLDDGDFVLKIAVGPATPILSGANPANTACTTSVSIKYYRYQSGSLGEVEGPASATVAKAAYDYDTSGDSETQLWNLEIDMPIGTPDYPLKTVAPFFAMGVYVFVDQDHNQLGQTGNVLRWPDKLAERAISEADPVFPALDFANLADVSLSDVCFNASLAAALEATPWELNDQPQKDGDAHLNPYNQPNKFRVRFYYDGPGDNVTAGSNHGEVRITVMPYNGSSFDPAWAPSPASVEMSSYNVDYVADFTAPANTFPSTMKWACSDLYLQNFTHDDNTTDADNHIHINHNYIHTSQYTQEIQISAKGIPGLSAGKDTSVVLNFSSTNDPAGRRVGALPDRGRRGTGLALLALGVGSVAGAAGLRRRRGLAVLLVAVGAMAAGAGCNRFYTRETIGNDRWQVVNAKELGIKPIANQPGWYRMPLRADEVKTVQIHFVDAALPYSTRVDTLRMNGDTQPRILRYPVREAHVVSIVAPGLVDVDGPDGPAQPNSAAGFTRQDNPGDMTAARLAASNPYLLSATRNIPAQNVGALIGSFDGFKTSFVVGTNLSFVVPKGASELQLAINGRRDDYRKGSGFLEVNFIDEPPPHVPTATPMAYETDYDNPSFVVPWKVLTAVHVKTFYDVPMKVGTAMKSGLAELGEAHVSVYRTQ